MFYSVIKNSFPVNLNYAYLYVILSILTRIFCILNYVLKICFHSIASSEVSTYNLCQPNSYTITEYSAL